MVKHSDNVDNLILDMIGKSLKIFATIPATATECEYSTSVLRQLTNYMQVRMMEERLITLA